MIGAQWGVLCFIGTRYDVPDGVRWAIGGVLTGTGLLAALSGSKLLVDAKFWGKLGFATVLLGLLGLGAWLYFHYVWYAPPRAFTWRGAWTTSSSRRGCSGSCCSRRTSSGCIGQSLADLPLRAARALGRAARRRSSRCSRSASPGSRAPRRRRRCAPSTSSTSATPCRTRRSRTRGRRSQQALDAKAQGRPRPPRHLRAPPARRPARPTTRREAPEIARHDRSRAAKRQPTASGFGAATDIASALQLAYGLYPDGLPAARGDPLRRRADRRRSARRGEPGARATA